jgi:hypothetical protein
MFRSVSAVALTIVGFPFDLDPLSWRLRRSCCSFGLGIVVAGSQPARVSYLFT